MNLDKIAGIWQSPDTSFVLTIKGQAIEEIDISAKDVSDGENIPIYDIKEDRGSVCFRSVVLSTGYEVLYKIAPHDDGLLRVEYTTTEDWLLVEKIDLSAVPCQLKDFIGTWRYCELDYSSLIFKISCDEHQKLQVSAVSSHYEESSLDVSNVAIENNVLSFYIISPEEIYPVKYSLMPASRHSAMKVKTTFTEAWGNKVVAKFRKQ